MLVIVRLVSILGTILFFCLYSEYNSLFVPTYHFDGAFQTASGLFRILNNELPGRDFYPYLGIGPNYFLFPIFSILGGGLTDSVFASFFMTIISSWISFYFIIFLITKKHDSASFLSLIFLILILLGYISFPERSEIAVDPGTSLKSIRSFAPYLLAIAFYATHKKIQKSVIRCTLLALLSSLFIIWSNDFAYVTVFFSSVLFFLLFSPKSITGKIKYAISYSFYLLTLSLIFLFVTTNGNVIEYLSYSFIDVRIDQWWYFWPYRSELRVLNITDLYSNHSLLVSALAVSFLTLFVLPLTKKTIESYILCFIGVTLFFGGCVSTIGGHISYVYFTPYFLFIIVFYSSNLLLYLNKPLDYKYRFLTPILHCCLVAILVGGTMLEITNKENMIDHSEYYYNDSLGGYLHKDWHPYIQFFEKNKEKRIIEEYWGIASTTTKTASLLDVDSVIHALGSVRAKSKNAMDEADYIVTSNPEISGWVNWSLSQNHWLYSELSYNWKPILFSPTTIVWERSSRVHISNSIECSITEDGSGIYIYSDNVQFVDVSIEFDLEEVNRQLLSFDNKVGKHSGLSINPRSSSFNTFIRHDGDVTNKYRLASYGPELVNRAIITKCAARDVNQEFERIFIDTIF